MDSMSDAFTSTMEFIVTTVDMTLTINRHLVSAFYGALWYVASWIFTIFESIYLCLQMLVDIGYDSCCFFYWCAENFLISISRAILRVDFISQIVPDAIAAMIFSIFDWIFYFLRYCYFLFGKVIYCLILPVQLLLSTLEYVGRELRESACELAVGIAALGRHGKTIPREVYTWLRINLTRQNIKSFIVGLPYIWSIDFYLSLLLLLFSIFLLCKLISFMKRRHLTLWPLYIAVCLRRFGFFVRRKMRKWTGKDEEAKKAVGADSLSLALLDGSNLCIICMAIPRDTLLLPCRHLCLCSQCWDSLELSRMCPICRTDVTAFVSDVFLS